MKIQRNCHLHSSFSILEDGEMATSSLTILPQGDGVMATCILPCSIEDGEMATAILTVLPQGGRVMATSSLLFLFYRSLQRICN